MLIIILRNVSVLCTICIRLCMRYDAHVYDDDELAILTIDRYYFNNLMPLNLALFVCVGWLCDSY